MKKIFILLLLLPLWRLGGLYAQKELWGLSITNDGTFDSPGNIFKTDLNGQNIQVVYNFNTLDGKTPLSRLFLASNGKLYGTTASGGSFYVNFNDGGTLFEYDLTIDSLRVVKNFGQPTDPPANFLYRPFSDLIEPIPGVLFGGCRSKIFRYDIATGNTSIAVNMPTTVNGANSSTNDISDQLVKGSNGFLYSLTTGLSSCSATSQEAGTILKLDPSNNGFSQPYLFPCFNPDNGYFPKGNLIEGSPGKLYGTTPNGGTNEDGVLFEYDIATNTYTKKFDFDAIVSGKSPTGLINGNNGKLYGITENGGSNPCSPTSQYGTLFEYDIANEMVNTLVNMGCDGHGSSTLLPHGTLLKASNGYIFGIMSFGIFKFDSNTNVAVDACPDCPFIPNFRYGSCNGLIEICRKPSYHFFDVDTFDGCIGSTFTYDVQNTNAATYQWLKDGTDVPSQTMGVLNLANLQTSDAGDYTCLMTNECGTTTTMALHLTVNCLGTNTVAKLDKSIKLYPNPTTNWLNIELPKNIEIAVSSCSITNLLGQTVYQSPTSDKIDVSHLQKGIYIVTIDTNYGKWNGKFVKE